MFGCNNVTEIVQQLKCDPAIEGALNYVRDHLAEAIAVQKELVLIEAPTFNEKNKALRYAELLRESGLEDVRMDEHFNVWGRIRGTSGDRKAVLLEGHLDTVFSFGDVKGITEDADGKLHCPGICDDTRALAANLSVLRAIKTTGLTPFYDIIIAGTVCEEGLGGMRGMKQVLENIIADGTELLGTISIDGASAGRFYANATGMVDWNITFTGPGGHAWTAYGKPSALHAAGRAIAALSDLRLPTEPKTILTVSLIEGGQAIHGIAQKTALKINSRSNSQQELDSLNETMKQICKEAAKAENARWNCVDGIDVSFDLILDVPAGNQKDDAPIIELTKAVTRSVGVEPLFIPGGCTNTNMSIARGIPAVTLGRGGEEYGTHTLNEWFNPEGVYRCEQKSILMLFAIAGIAGKFNGMALK